MDTNYYLNKFKSNSEELGRDKALLQTLSLFIGNISDDVEKCNSNSMKSESIIHVLNSSDKKWTSICKKIIAHNYIIDKEQVQKESEGKKSIKFKEYNKFWIPKYTKTLKVTMNEKFDGLKHYWK